MANVYGIGIAIIFGLTGLYFRLKLGPIFHEQKTSLHWPSVEGKIIESKINEKKHREKDHGRNRSEAGALLSLIDRRVSHITYHPIIRYSFVVNGIEYQSDQEMLRQAFDEVTGIGFGHIERKRRIDEKDIGVNGDEVKDGYFTPHGHFRSPEKAQEVADKYPLGRLVEVFYNPNSPKKCFLVKHEPPSERWVKITSEILPFVLIGVSLIVLFIAFTASSL